jgi:hypothetical protein
MVSSDRNVRSGAVGGDVSTAGYRLLAESRYRSARSLHFSEEAHRSQHIEPQQSRFLPAIKELPGCIRTGSTNLVAKDLFPPAGLFDRFIEQDAFTLAQNHNDDREISMDFTPPSGSFPEGLQTGEDERKGESA